MASDRVVATDANGYLFQLPSLGLPDPAGERVQVCGAIGPKDQCIALVEGSDTSNAPLRQSNTKYNHLEVEYKGAVWRFPTALRCTGGSLPQLFSTKVQRVPAAKASIGTRTKLPDEVDWIYMNKEAQQLEMGQFRGSEKQLLDLHKTLGGQFTMKVLRHYRRCINPSSSEAEPIVPPIESNSPGAAAQRKKKTKGLEQAWTLWLSLSSSSISKDWLKQLHNDAVAAGLRESTDKFDSNDNLARFRVSPEDDWDIRGLDYALCSKDWSRPSAAEAEWLPVPEHAAEASWVRLGVNLMRYEVGRKLITKEEWPPRATTLMMQKGGGEGSSSSCVVM